MVIGFCRIGQHGCGNGARLGRRDRRRCCTPTRDRAARPTWPPIWAAKPSTRTPSWPSGADIVVLAVKPAQLEEVAAELAGARTVVSLLGATPLSAVEAAFPDADVIRVMPNVAVEVRRGVLCVAGAGGA